MNCRCGLPLPPKGHLELLGRHGRQFVPTFGTMCITPARCDCGSWLVVPSSIGKPCHVCGVDLVAA